MAKAGRGADQYMLRFPPGLRDRIKAYAAYQGRSMNEEIIRILEREFPEPVTASGSIYSLLEVVKMIAAGAPFDENVEKLADGIGELIEGIYSGRVEGIEPAARKEIEDMWTRYQEDLAKEGDGFEYDDTEIRSLELTGRTSKFVWPDGRVGPERPKRSWDDLGPRDDPFEDPFEDGKK
ncbi:Arc family DNA-binding protein [Rhizobiaceae sp. 2RAB30]